MASAVEICNRALQKVGGRRIVALDEDTPNARACNVAYQPVLDAELRAHTWNFAIKRAELAADATAPDFGRTNSFQLPSDFLRLLPQYPEDVSNSLDWQIEGRKILTDDTDPIQIRYVYRVSDPNEMDALFREALAARLAIELCEELTQSNTKRQSLREEYKEVIKEAKKANAFENVSQTPPEDTWVTCRV